MQNIEFWTRVIFQPVGYTGLTCPTCSAGDLFISERELMGQDTKASWDSKTNGDWPDERVQLFSVILKCTNAGCGDAVACLGHIYFGMKPKPNLSYPDFECPRYCEPIYFHPPLKIIDIKPSYPEEIQEELTISFSHFFRDPSACANKIRASIEALLTTQKVKKINVNKKNGRRERITLHGRIELFANKNKDIANHLKAIKWIGNSGSRADSYKLMRKDVLDAYEILDYCLNKLYSDPTKRVEKLTKSINKKKGPRSKGRRTKYTT